MNGNRQLAQFYLVFLPMQQMFPAVQQPPAPVQPAPPPMLLADQLTQPIEEQGYHKTTRLVVCVNPPPSRDSGLVVGLTTTKFTYPIATGGKLTIGKHQCSSNLRSSVKNLINKWRITWEFIRPSNIP